MKTAFRYLKVGLKIGIPALLVLWVTVSLLILYFESPRFAEVKIRLVAKRYQWLAHYPGEDGRFGSELDVESESLTITDPQGNDDFISRRLVFPTDTRVGLFLTSADLIHSLRGLEGLEEVDLLPGVNSGAVFRSSSVSKEGEFRCGILCGIGHADHKGTFTIVEEREFANWLRMKSTENRVKEDAFRDGGRSPS